MSGGSGWLPFVPAVLDDFPLDPYEFRVLARIARRQDGPNGRGCDESNARTGRECGISESRVRDAKAMLVAAGLVRVETRNGRPNVYRLAPPDEWCAPDEVAPLRQHVRARRTPDRRKRLHEHTAVPQTAVPQTAVQGDAGGTAVPQTEGRGSTNRGTAVPQTDEGTPTRFSRKDDVVVSDLDNEPGPVEDADRICRALTEARDLTVDGGLRRLIADVIRGTSWPVEDLAGYLVEQTARPGIRNLGGYVRTLLEELPHEPPSRRPTGTAAGNPFTVGRRQCERCGQMVASGHDCAPKCETCRGSKMTTSQGAGATVVPCPDCASSAAGAA